MVEFLFTRRGFGMLHQRFENAVCRCSDGDRSRWCLFHRGLSLIPAIAIAAIGMVVGSAPAAEPTEQPSAASTTISTATDSVDISPDQARESVQWLSTLALNRAPRSYSGEKDWGRQKEIWSGVKVKLDGLRLKTHRRQREVNHGRWLRYTVTLPPTRAAESTDVTIHRVQRPRDPVTGQPRWQIDSSLTVPMDFTAQIQRWNRGIKVFSLTIRGDMRLRLNSTASVDFVADYTEVPPALVVDPRIDQAELVLEHFEVDRVSKIGGDVAEQWGELVEDVIVDRFLKEQNEKLVDKLNRAINKERDDLRWSITDALSSSDSPATPEDPFDRQR